MYKLTLTKQDLAQYGEKWELEIVKNDIKRIVISINETEAGRLSLMFKNVKHEGQFSTPLDCGTYGKTTYTN